MLARATPAITRSDYEAMPSGPPYFQLIEGELVMSPSPSPRHQRIVGRIFSVLHYSAAERQLGEVFVAPLDVFLNETNVHQPDIVYVSNNRAGHVSDAGIEGAPDLCVEVLSKTTARFDRIAKKKVFAQAGVAEYWLFDPEAQTIEVFDFASDSERAVQVLDSRGHLRSPLFPGLEINLAEIFTES